MVPSTVVSDSVHRGDRSPPADRAWTGARAMARRGIAELRSLSPAWRDALLYGCSALFAGGTGLIVRIPLYRQWGQLAVGPYAVAALLMAIAAAGAARRAATRRPPTVRNTARVIAFFIVLFGATVVPLASRSSGPRRATPPSMCSPRCWSSNGPASGRPTATEPLSGDRPERSPPHPSVRRADLRALLPLPAGNGHLRLSSFTSVKSHSRIEATLTDARIQFLVVTVAIGLIALSRLRPPSDARVRALQALTVLPTAALPLATGGDDMPVVALMLARPGGPAAAKTGAGRPGPRGCVIAQVHCLGARGAGGLGRLRPGASARRRGLVRARGGRGHASRSSLPSPSSNPSAFVDNVIRFPLGLAGVSSPAASALPGHILVSICSSIHRPYVLIVGLVGVVVLLWYRDLAGRRPTRATWPPSPGG